MTQTIASFDLGIKNLSYAVVTFDASGALVAVNRWANLNLLAGGADSQSQTRCGICQGPASWQDKPAGTIYCKKCVRARRLATCDDTAKPLAALREAAPALLGCEAAEVRRLKKTEIVDRIAARFLIPYKAPKSKGVSLQTLLAGMETCLNAELPHLAAAQRIRLENQPSEFAPHMKSIQIMLFTLIDHRLRTEFGWGGVMEFVNAGVKTRGTGAGVGKAAKKERKEAGMARLEAILTEGGQTEQLAWWRGQVKRDDLADAFLMCVDAVASV